jgi:hypothetical protein
MVNVYDYVDYCAGQMGISQMHSLAFLVFGFRIGVDTDPARYEQAMLYVDTLDESQKDEYLTGLSRLYQAMAEHQHQG